MKICKTDHDAFSALDELHKRGFNILLCLLRVINTVSTRSVIMCPSSPAVVTSQHGIFLNICIKDGDISALFSFMANLIHRNNLYYMELDLGSSGEMLATLILFVPGIYYSPSS